MHRVGIAAKAMGTFAVVLVVVSILAFVAFIALLVILGKGLGP